MTMHGLLMWCLGAGAVVVTSAVAATGYQLLERQHAQDQAKTAPRPVAAALSIPSPAAANPGAANPPSVMAATKAQPAAAAANPVPAPPPAATPRYVAAPRPPLHRHAAAALLPPLRRHVADAAAAAGYAAHPAWSAARRAEAAKLAAHYPVPRPRTLPITTPRPPVPSYRPGWYAPPGQAGVWYPPPPTPPVGYYPYPGYYAYGSGYAGYPRYPRGAYSGYPYDPVN